MGATTFSTGLPASWSFSEIDDLSALDKVETVYAVGENAVVVATRDNREIRITAWQDLRTRQYRADYERRSSVRVGGTEFRVWSQTPAYRRCVADDAESCLEAAVLEVDRTHVF